jgi:hypothetical protein
MKALIAVLLFAMSSHVAAVTVKDTTTKPVTTSKDVVIKNEAGGEIVFTFLPGSCADNRLRAYIVDKHGEVVLAGCWLWDSINDKAFVRWSDGTTYRY